jgi:hypothetical protein
MTFMLDQGLNGSLRFGLWEKRDAFWEASRLGLLPGGAATEEVRRDALLTLGEPSRLAPGRRLGAGG